MPNQLANDQDQGNSCGCSHSIEQHEEQLSPTCAVRNEHHNEQDSLCSCSHDHNQSGDHIDEESCSACGHDHSHSHEQGKIDWGITALMGLFIAVSVVMEYLQIGGFIPRILLLSVIVVEGYRPARNGLKALRKRVIGIDLLMSIAAVGALIIGEYAEGAMVLFLKDISLKLELFASNRARHAISALMNLRPEVALIKRNGGEVEVPVENVVPGEVFIVKPGDRIPLDGVVVGGETTVDQSMMTGESVPIHKGYLEEVFAGTMNLD